MVVRKYFANHFIAASANHIFYSVSLCYVFHHFKGNQYYLLNLKKYLIENTIRIMINCVNERSNYFLTFVKILNL